MCNINDITAINSLYQGYEAALNAGDAPALAATFTDNAVVMPHDASLLIGREAIQSWYEKAMDSVTAKQTGCLEEVEVADGWAFVRGSFKTAFTPKTGGESTEMSGHYLAIGKRHVGGDWKYARLIWSSDKALPGTGK